MPEFMPGESKTAVAPITVKPSGLNCEAEVFLGPDDLTKVATSGLVPFISTGASQDVHLPITMPSAEGTYHVFIDIYVEGLLIAAYQALEDVSIVALYDSFAIESIRASTWMDGSYFTFNLYVTVKNYGTGSGSHPIAALFTNPAGETLAFSNGNSNPATEGNIHGVLFLEAGGEAEFCLRKSTNFSEIVDFWFWTMYVGYLDARVRVLADSDWHNYISEATLRVPSVANIWVDPHLYFVGVEPYAGSYFYVHFRTRIENRGTGPGTRWMQYSGSSNTGPIGYRCANPTTEVDYYACTECPNPNLGHYYPLTLNPGEAIDFEFAIFCDSSWGAVILSINLYCHQEGVCGLVGLRSDGTFNQGQAPETYPY